MTGIGIMPGFVKDVILPVRLAMVLGSKAVYHVGRMLIGMILTRDACVEIRLLWM
jgi:hypothetical protein